MDLNALMQAAQRAGVDPGQIAQAGQAMAGGAPVGAAQQPPDRQAMMAQMLGQMGGGGDPRMAQAGQSPQQVDPNSMPMPVSPMGRGPATDMEMQDMDDAQASMMAPQTAPRMTGQQNMGAYMNANKPMSTEEELEDVSNKMGSGEDSTPSSAEVKALKSGEIDAKTFDAKWGKGAAKEFMNNDYDDEDDEGDHEYR